MSVGIWRLIVRSDVRDVVVTDNPTTHERTIVAPADADLDQVFGVTQLGNPEAAVYHQRHSPLLAELASRLDDPVYQELRRLRVAVQRVLVVLGGIAVGLAVGIAALLGIKLLQAAG